MIALLLGWLAIAPALATDDDAAYQAERDAVADDNFDTIMRANAAAKAAAAADTTVLMALGYTGDLSGVDVSALAQATPDAPVSGTATVPLERWEDAQARVKAVREARAGDGAPPVVLGASAFTGSAIDGALALTLTQHVTLSGDGLWKTVPIVGEQVVVVDASADGRPIPLSSRNGYHVWLTRQTGEVELQLDVLVPSRGRRGSLEYDFLVARTPSTSFDCTFGTEGLEPRLRGAVDAEIEARPGATRLVSWLEPSSRIHLVGFRDLGDGDGREARVYAESLDLLSVDDTAAELFSVVRYNILYAGTRRFDVAIPDGWTVVSADGEGAFRYTVDEDAGLLRGETPFPIRNRYELSLRLRRDTDGSALDLDLPDPVGVERAVGWLAVEVTGNVKLDEVDRGALLPVDPRQLPGEVLHSAVSPILRAYRYHEADARLSLAAERLPEMEPAGASIDRVDATTVVSDEGRTLTDVRITLRNRVRHSLALVLPEGAEVRSTLIDGAPAKPSVRDDGALLLPLRRSVGDRPFTLQVVLEGTPSALPVVGRRDLALPTLELPVASVAWSVWLPQSHAYYGVVGGPRGQDLAGNGRWFQAEAAGKASSGPPAHRPAETASMPVRIDVPTSGHELRDTRYWVAANAPMTLSVGALQRGLRPPLVLVLLGLLALGVAGGVRWGTARAWGRSMAAFVVAVGAASLVAVVAGTSAVGLGAALGVVAGVVRPGLLAGVRAWWRRPTDDGSASSPASPSESPPSSS